MNEHTFADNSGSMVGSLPWSDISLVRHFQPEVLFDAVEPKVVETVTLLDALLVFSLASKDHNVTFV